MKKIDMRCRPAIKSLQSSWIYDTESMVHFAKYFGGILSCRVCQTKIH